MLIYRGEFRLTQNQVTDQQQLSYPLAYGYACAGVVKETGTQVDKSWAREARVCLPTHCSHFITTHPNPFFQFPILCLQKQPVFCRTWRRRSTLCRMPRRSWVGASLFSAGNLGLLTSSLLMDFPLDMLVLADNFELRRRACEAEGRRRRPEFIEGSKVAQIGCAGVCRGGFFVNGQKVCSKMART